MKSQHVLGLLSAVMPAVALDADGWSKQSIYQLMTDRFARADGSVTAECDVSLEQYCGGSWQGIIRQLDYIQGMGFTAIWISPIVAQMEGDTADGSSFHGFWAQDIWQVNSHFGTEDDLKQLSDELHNRGMYLMVDIVQNHMAYKGCGDCVDYSIFNPFNSREYYHDFCLIDYSDEYDSNLQTCWEGDNVVSLPDLRTEDEGVRAVWTSWIAEMVTKYGIDGLRIDSVKHMEKSFNPIFEAASGVYNLGEVLHGDPDYTLDYTSHISGVTNYPAYFWLRRAFGSDPGDFTELSQGITTTSATAVNSSYLGNFLNNHDQDSWMSFQTDRTLNKNALTFLTAMDGIPIVFEGHEQEYGGDWHEARAALWFSRYDTTAELYGWIARLNAARNHVVRTDPAFVAYPAEPIYTAGLTLAMRKSTLVTVYSSAGTIPTDYDVALTATRTGYVAGQQLVEILACVLQTVGSDGVLVVTVEKGMPKMYRPLQQLLGSGICPDITGSGGDSGETSTTSMSTATSTTTAGTCTATSVAVTFEEIAVTVWGDTIMIVGSAPELGSWDVSSAIALDGSQYTDNNPLWTATVSLAAGDVVEYKFINVDSAGNVVWEADPNHTLTVGGCAAATTVASVW